MPGGRRSAKLGEWLGVGKSLGGPNDIAARRVHHRKREHQFRPPEYGREKLRDRHPRDGARNIDNSPTVRRFLDSFKLLRI